ncbi:facilitated trehalose transporter Tret1-2 homolog [Chrysoperla carnea]|uniref:facilitated trehalose transporter Tret1-2 homolog n=1 Tax=Chrysoperla carnea TaxID=189513 RepID=UPI001D07DC22|nr:facilitated trehalose transporter Tret1-2 homolog [Chrysoperla carnea]
MAQTKKENDYKYSEVLNEKPEEFELSAGTKKNYYFQEWVVSLIASMLFLITGIHYMWVSPILPDLLNGSEKIHITTEESVTIIGIFNVGIIPGTIGGSMLADRYGRRLTLIWTGVLFVISGIILIFSYTAFTLCVARFLAGISVGIGYTVVLVYCSEIASPEIRGILLIVMTTFVNIGIVVIYFIGTFLSFQMNTIVCGIFPVVTFLLLFYIPESPYYLIYKNDYVNAEKSLKFLRGRSNVTSELKQMKEGDTNQDNAQQNSFLALFTVKTNRWALFMAGGLICCTELTATNAISQYCNVIFEKANSSVMSADAGGIFQSIINLVVVFLCGSLVEKVGRRILLLASCLSSVFPLLAIGIFFSFQEHGYPNIDQFSLVPFIGLTSLKITVGLGIYCIPFIYIGELFPTNVKANASAICVILSTVFNTITIKMFQVLTDNLTYDIAFYVFSVLCLAAALFIYVFVPETRGKSFEEIQNDLRRIAK